jgi:beta-lactamase class C
MRIWALAVAAIACAVPIFAAKAEDTVQRIVCNEIFTLLPNGEPGGIQVAVSINGRTSFFSHGFADGSDQKPVTPDSLFNIASLRKPFEATVLADAVLRGNISLDDPVTKYLPELRDGRDITRVTVGQLATHVSGLLLPPDHPPWPTWHYSLAAFIDALRAWQADPPYEPGARHMYTHAGYILLQLVLERALAGPINQQVSEVILEPLGMQSSVLPMRRRDGRADLEPALLDRAVQGYGEDGSPVGMSGDQQTYYDWPGTGQMFSSARDLIVFLDASLGERRAPDRLVRAMAKAQAPAFAIGPHNAQALAWEIEAPGATAIVEKNGGLNNTSAYMAMMPSTRIGIVVLSNRGGKDVATAGHRALRMLSQTPPQ